MYEVEERLQGGARARYRGEAYGRTDPIDLLTKLAEDLVEARFPIKQIGPILYERSRFLLLRPGGQFPTMDHIDLIVKWALAPPPGQDRSDATLRNDQEREQSQLLKAFVEHQRESARRHAWECG